MSAQRPEWARTAQWAIRIGPGCCNAGRIRSCANQLRAFFGPGFQNRMAQYKGVPWGPKKTSRKRRPRGGRYHRTSLTRPLSWDVV
jgi:hypothetical protein